MFACEKIDLLLKTRYIHRIWVPLKLGHGIHTHTHTLQLASTFILWKLKLTHSEVKKAHWTIFGCVDSCHSTQLLHI